NSIRWKSVAISYRSHLKLCLRSNTIWSAKLPSIPTSVPRTSEVASNRSAPNSNNLPANSIGAAAAVLPNVADLFANAFKPLGNTAPTVDQANTNQTSVDQPRVNHDNVDPLLATLLPLPSSCTSSHHATSTRSETGASTAAIQEQLTTENSRDPNHHGEHSDQESIAIITDLPIPNSLAQATLNAAAARRNFPPTTEFLFEPTWIPHGNSHRQLSGSGHVSGTSNQEPPLVGGTHDNRCVDFVNRGMESYYRSLAENSGEPTIRQNRTQPYQRRARDHTRTGEQLPDPGHSSPTSSHPGGSPTAPSTGRTPERRERQNEEPPRVPSIGVRRDLLSGSDGAGRLPVGRPKQTPKEILEILFSKIEQVVDGNSERAVAQIQKSLPTLSVSLSRELSTPLSSKISLLQDSLHEVVAHLASKPECDSAKLVQVIQELDVRVHRVEALVEANLHKETEFPYVHSSEPVSSGIDTARIQTIVENTMSKHIACLESVLITRLNQTTRRETDNVELSEDLEQKLEIHSENQRKAFCKLSDCLDRDSHLLHEKIDRATGQFRSGEARLRDEVVELSQLIRDHGSQTRQETTTSPPVQNRRMPHAHGWFDTARLTKPSQKWKFWRAELWKKYGTSTWKHKIEDSFDADKFVPGEVSPATWVTRQYNRLQCFAPDASQEAINFKLLRLVDNEVEYAAKTAMRGEEVDLTLFINILEDICDKTRLGALVIEATRGRNNLVRMTCCNLDCMVLLDSGAVSSVVGKHYLQRFCPGWRDFILPVETGKFHSASGTLIPLGVVHIKFFMKSIELKVRFVVMDNMSAKYFILGNDYLVAYKISLLNKERRQFTMGSKVFDFDESINAIEQTTTPESSFVSEYPLEICRDQLPFPSQTLPSLEYDMVGQTTLDSYFRSPRTSEVASNRSAPNSNNLPANSIGAAAAVLPNVADLFANAFKPLVTLLPPLTKLTPTRLVVNHDNVDPLLASHTTNDIDPALLPLPSSCTSSHHATSTRSETGASTAAIQEQLTTENVRNLNGRAETQTITGEHSDQESIAIITDLPIPNSLAQATLNAAAARRNFPPTTSFCFEPTWIPHGNSHRQLSGSGHVSGTSNQEPPLVGGTHDNRCVDFVNRGMESYYRSLAENSGGTNDPTKPNSTVPATGQGPHPVQESNSPTLDTHRQQAPTPEVRPPHPPRGGPRGGNGRMRNLPEYRASCSTRSFEWVGWCRALTSRSTKTDAVIKGTKPSHSKEILEILFSKIEQVVDGNSERAVAQIQKSLPTLSVSLSRELSTPLSSKISLLQDSLHEVVAHLASKPECDSAKLVQVIQELDVRVHRVEALVEANLHKETEFPYVHSSEPVSSGIDTARIQTIVENTMSKHIACLESVLITRLNQTTRRETDNNKNLRFIAKINFRSGEARLRDEVVELSQLIRDHGSQTRQETTTSPPVQNRRMPQSTVPTDGLTQLGSPNLARSGSFGEPNSGRKYGTSTWKHKIEDSFDADKFVPGEVSPATWVTRQYNRLQCFAPDASQEAINFKLLRLVDNEVEYAAKTAMRGEEVDLTLFINILEDICDKTRLGALVIEATRGRNNLVRMTCCNLDCMVLLDSGAVSSVVGKHYLQRFCPGWRDFILPVETGKFHSASGTLIPLGVVHIKFFMKSIELKVRFVVMDNMSAKYFILGNDYLVAYKISLLNKERRQFTMGSKVFDFDESINAIEQTTTPESSFVSE
ncbi:hypothetical protein PSTT_11237, partial [Puccinia striiformis]